MTTSTYNDSDRIAAQSANPILKHFEFAHLPAGALRDTSAKFNGLAYDLATNIPRSAELTVSLRKLLEAKDAAVRAAKEALDAEKV
jgi:hypothetical protein